MPVYFVLVEFAGTLEVLAHRITWSIPLLLFLIWIGKQWQTLSLGTLLRLALCAVLLAINWLTFIYGVHQGKIAETSLGYFVTPFLTILFGALVFRESMSRVQLFATGVAGTGVLLEVLSVAYFPWIAVALALSFACYGAMRRHLQMPAALGLGIETAILAPVAMLYILWADSPVRSGSELALLGMGGLVTVVPLLCFGAAARRLPLTVLGYFQYLAPTLSLLIAVFVYDETVSPGRWLSFGCVWLALLAIVVDGARVTEESPRPAS